MWWIYFHKGAKRFEQISSQRAGAAGASGLYYLHMPMWRIISSAVADECADDPPTIPI